MNRQTGALKARIIRLHPIPNITLWHGDDETRLQRFGFRFRMIPGALPQAGIEMRLWPARWNLQHEFADKNGQTPDRAEALCGGAFSRGGGRGQRGLADGRVGEAVAGVWLFSGFCGLRARPEVWPFSCWDANGVVQFESWATPQVRLNQQAGALKARLIRLHPIPNIAVWHGDDETRFQRFGFRFRVPWALPKAGIDMRLWRALGVAQGWN